VWQAQMERGVGGRENGKKIERRIKIKILNK